MGLCYTHGQLQLWQDVCRDERIVLSGLKMAELGNQLVRGEILQRPHRDDIAAKLIFEAMGVIHTSFDVNGKNGALKMDLSQPITEQHRNAYDMVTNFGTSEHVERSQYWVWRNIHDMCRAGGWMLHGIPEVGSWPNHGKWHYTMPRVLNLASACGYDTRISRRFEYKEAPPLSRLKHCLMLCFRKGGGTFPQPDVFKDLMFPEGESWY